MFSILHFCRDFIFVASISAHSFSVFAANDSLPWFSWKVEPKTYVKEVLEYSWFSDMVLYKYCSNMTKYSREPNDPSLLAEEEKYGKNKPNTILIPKIIYNNYMLTLIDAILWWKCTPASTNLALDLAPYFVGWVPLFGQKPHEEAVEWKTWESGKFGNFVCIISTCLPTFL